MRRVHAPSLGHEVAFGRTHEVAPGPHFRFAQYRTAAMPQHPESVSFATESTTAVLADIYGNDVLGDCVIAWLLHHLALFTGNATGTAFHATRDQAIGMYSAIGGYVPGDPSTDRGCDMTTALNWIVAHGWPNGDHPIAWMRVNGSDPEEVKQALWLFEGCGIALDLPDDYIGSMPNGNGFLWDKAGPPNPKNGHAILGCGYDSIGINIDTWGILGSFTWGAVAQYAVPFALGEIDILLSPDMILKASQKAPNGIDWVSLLADFRTMGGKVPDAPPTPAPPAPAVATLPWAQGVVGHALLNGPLLMGRHQAAGIADAALDAAWPKS